MEKINPFIDTSNVELANDELITYLNINMLKDIILKDKYMISNKGRIFSYNKDDILKELKANNNNTKKYYRVLLRNELNKSNHISVHRAVLSSFNPVPNMDELTVNHIDGDKSNNCLENLEWCTNIENIHHACNNGLRGDSDSITDETIIKIIDLANKGISDLEISKIVNLKVNTVENVRIGHNYMKNRLKKLELEPVHILNRITDDIIRDVIRMANNGMSDISIANELGLKYNTVKNIRVGRRGRFDDKLEKLGLKPVINEKYVNVKYK